MAVWIFLLIIANKIQTFLKPFRMMMHTLFSTVSLAARRFALAAVLIVAGGLFALAADEVTIDSPGPGQLQLTPDALIAPRLKVTGSIDARDFETLKAVTMAVTQELDLSEATICEYSGRDGSYTPITPDWIVGTERPRFYKAGEMPVHAFTKVGDNSLTKWHYGGSLAKLTLPASISSVSAEAFWKMEWLAEIEVPASSATARSIGGAVYDRGVTRLLAVAPMQCDCLVIPATVTSVADSALHGATLRGIRIEGGAKVDFGEQGSLNCPYVIAPNPGDYAGLFDGIDVISDIDEIAVSCPAEDSLAQTVGDRGIKAADVRSLTVSGIIGENDMEWLAQLPNLHFLDLAGATFAGYKVEFIGHGALCSLSLPSGSYALTIADCPFLGGRLDVPEGVTYVNCKGAPLITAVRLPSTLTRLEAGSFASSLMAEADLSACGGLKEVSAFGSCYRLRTLLLPPRLEVLTGISGPVEAIELPEGLRELVAQGWNVETMQLPASLEMLDISYMLRLKTLDASVAVSLREATGPSFCPLIEEVDFSASPLERYYGICFDLLPATAAGAAARPPQRVVVVGGTHATCIHSSLRALRLPSTLMEIAGYGIKGCAKLEELDLQGCSALGSVSSLSGLTSLATLRLPADLTRIESMTGCPALADIYVAADKAVPAFGLAPAEGVLERAVLRVPTGSRGLYFSDTQWSRCKEITEYGYTVRTATDISGVPLAGAGLYAPGSRVRLSAPAKVSEGGFVRSFAEWVVGAQAFGTPVAEFAAEAAVTATAVYGWGSVDPDAADMGFTVTAPEAGELYLSIDCYEGYAVYGEQGFITRGDAYSETILSVPAGTSRFALVLVDEPTAINLWEHSSTGSMAVSRLYFGSLPSLKSLTVGGLGLDTIDLAPMPSLTYLSLSGNALGTLDVSACPGLEWLDCSNNRLTKLVLCPETQLTTFGCNFNSFGFSQIPDRLQSALEHYYADYTASIVLNYVPPFDLGTGDVLDLSGEQFSANGHPVAIRFAYGGSEVASQGGRYAIAATGWYEVDMTCADMPWLKFVGYFCVDGPSGVEPLPLDGVRITSEGLRVSVSGLPAGSSSVLLSATGAQVGAAVGGEVSLSAGSPGVYILRLTDDAGRTQAVKLALK